MNPYKINDIITFNENNCSPNQRRNIFGECGEPPYTVVSINNEWVRIRKKNGHIDGWPYTFFKKHNKVKITLDEDLFTL